MNNTRAARPIPIALTALVAFFSALAALAVSNGMDMAQAHGNARASSSHGSDGDDRHRRRRCRRRAVALHADMRKLWEDHVTWTRLAIISLVAGTPDTDATVARLLRNQIDIGNAIKPYYGTAAGNELTRQLRSTHPDRRRRDPGRQGRRRGEARGRAGPLDKNADQIAATLASVNPRYWKLGDDEGEMHMHLKLTTDEAVARLKGNWTADVSPTTRCTTTSSTCRTCWPTASSSSSPPASARRSPGGRSSIPASEQLGGGTPEDAQAPRFACGTFAGNVHQEGKDRQPEPTPTRHADENDNRIRPSTRSPTGGGTN